MRKVLVAFTIGIVVSCGTAKKTEKTESIRDTFNINFTSNILNLDSSGHHSEAELFVLDLLRSNLYEVAQRDADIYFGLSALDSSLQIQKINIRFLKNEEAILDQFLEGKLDLITLEEDMENTSRFDFFYRQIEQDKYSRYQIVKGNKAKLKWLEFSNFKRTNELEKTMKSMSIVNSFYSYVDTLNLLKDTSSVYRSISVLCADSLIESRDSLVSFIAKSEYQGYIPTVQVKTEEIGFMTDDADSLISRLYRESEQKDPSANAIVILEIYPEYYITSRSLRGLKDYTKLSTALPSMYFGKVKSY